MKRREHHYHGCCWHRRGPRSRRPQDKHTIALSSLVPWEGDSLQAIPVWSPGFGSSDKRPACAQRSSGGSLGKMKPPRYYCNMIIMTGRGPGSFPMRSWACGLWRAPGLAEEETAGGRDQVPGPGREPVCDGLSRGLARGVLGGQGQRWICLSSVLSLIRPLCPPTYQLLDVRKTKVCTCTHHFCETVATNAQFSVRAGLMKQEAWGRCTGV